MMVRDERAADVTVDVRVLEYVARAPMTYPVSFDLLPKWPPVPSPPVSEIREKSGRS